MEVTMKKIAFGLIALFSVVLLLSQLISCSSNPGNNVITPDPTVSEFQYSDPNTYTVESTPNSVIHDSTTGVTLSFPEGGLGNVTISKITSNPITPLEGEGVKIEYSGDTPIDLVVDTSDGLSATILEYGNFNGCFDDSIGNGERWTEVPRDVTNESEISFMLMMPYDLKKSVTGKKIGSNNFWIARLKPTADKVDQRIAVSLQIDTYYKQFLATLPTSIKDAVINKRKSRFLSEDFSSGGHYYSGFWMRAFGKGITYQPTIHLSLPPKSQVIAHETGHYLIHLLVGDNVQSTLEGQGNLFGGHGVLDVVGRNVVLEDLAYFTEFFLTGSGADAYNLFEPYDMLRGKSPLKTDFPSYEGFTAHFLAQLVRSNPKIRDYSDGTKFRPIPLLNLSYGQVFEIISKGATGINDLRANIEQYLGKKANALPVIGHRLGWRYTLKGKLVDPKGNSVSNATIEPLVIFDGATYKGKFSGVCKSGTDGSFLIAEEGFPGKSILRIKYLTDSVDVPIEVDWNKPTTEIIDLGTIQVNPQIRIKSIDIGIAYTGSFVETYPEKSYSYHSQSTIEGIYNGGDNAISGNTFSSTTVTTMGVYNQTSNIYLTFDDINNPTQILDFGIDNDGIDTFTNTIVKESAAGSNIPFSFWQLDKEFQYTYYGNISSFLSKLTYLSTREEEFTRTDGTTFTATVPYELVGFDSQGSITIVIEYE